MGLAVSFGASGFYEVRMATLLRFLAVFLILAGSWGALDALRERPATRHLPLRYLVTAGLVAASWWFSRL
jgi:hypothetical protein